MGAEEQEGRAELEAGFQIETPPVDGVGRWWFQVGMRPPPDLSRLTEAEKDALILALWTRVAELEARRDAPPKTPGNSSLPPSRGHKADRSAKAKPPGPPWAGPAVAAPWPRS